MTQLIHSHQIKSKPKILILGAGYAGLLATLRLAGRVNKKNDYTITLINAEDDFVERIRLHQLSTGQKLAKRPIRQLLRNKNVDFVRGYVTHINSETQCVDVTRVDGPSQEISYDYLIYALGSKSNPDDIPGVRVHAHALNGEADSLKLRQKLDQLPSGGRVLIIGGGLTGIESATEIAERYADLHITIATRGRLGQDLAPAAQDYLHRRFKQLKIKRIENTGVMRLESHEAITDDANNPAVATDLTVWAGQMSVSPLAKAARLPVDDTGRILVDRSLRVHGHANIYAVGDAAVVHTRGQMPGQLRMACATAMPMAGYAADHLIAVLQNRPEPDPFKFAYGLRCISLGRRAGLVQFTSYDDTASQRFIGGRTGSVIKELICRFTIWALKMERLFPGSYFWPQSEKLI